jgi:outer membrane autotransporter protein
VKGGFDIEADIPGRGRAVLGGYLRHASSQGLVQGRAGAASVSAEAHCLGITALLLPGEGSYLDLQGALMLGSGELEAGGDTPTMSNVPFTVLAASAEVGHVFDLGRFGRLTPSAELQAGSVRAEAFTDDLGNRVDLGSNETFSGAVSLAWQSGEPSGSDKPVLALELGYTHAFDADTTVRVGPASISASMPGDWLDARMGLDWAFGEASALQLRAGYGVALAGDAVENRRAGLSLQLSLGF